MLGSERDCDSRRFPRAGVPTVREWALCNQCKIRDRTKSDRSREYLNGTPSFIRDRAFEDQDPDEDTKMRNSSWGVDLFEFLISGLVFLLSSFLRGWFHVRQKYTHPFSRVQISWPSNKSGS